MSKVDFQSKALFGLLNCSMPLSETCLERPLWKDHSVCKDHFPIGENVLRLESVQTEPVWKDCFELVKRALFQDIKGVCSHRIHCSLPDTDSLLCEFLLANLCKHTSYTF